MSERVVLYELNEVPWRVLDWYVDRKPDSAIARLVAQSSTFTTITRDEGELHPWTTWPTLHRGVSNSQHHIRFINQDLTTAHAFPPLWETLSKASKSVGVFGSLQSYPPPQDVRAQYAFYVPDTFARGPESYPDECVPFQRLNLRQTRQDGASAQDVQLNASVLGDLVGTIRAGLTLTTVVKLSIHLLNERINPKYRSRRSVMQAPVAFDVYKRLLLKTHPEFSTFFTNHVAGMMHRYWKFAFPEDFEASEAETLDAFHAGSIEYAMDVANEQISWLMSYCERDQAQLVVASSMGQEAIDRGAYEGEWRIEDTSMFLNMLGWRGEVHNALAMQPDFNFVLKSQHDAESFVAHLLCAHDAKGKSIWKRSAVSGATVNMGLAPSATALDDGEFWFSVSSGERRCVSIADAGISKINRDPGTGYHQPRGSLLWWNGKNGASDASRREIELTSVRAMILEAFGVDE